MLRVRARDLHEMLPQCPSLSSIAISLSKSGHCRGPGNHSRSTIWNVRSWIASDAQLLDRVRPS